MMGIQSSIALWLSCSLLLQNVSPGHAFSSGESIILHRRHQSQNYYSSIESVMHPASFFKLQATSKNVPFPSRCKQGQPRRNFLQKSLSFALGITATTSFIQQPMVANAAMENAVNPFGGTKPLSVEEAKLRFNEGRKSIQYLLDHYDEICNGGGDNVRRYLGTVGTSSGLFGISKVMKRLSEEADDIVEYTETMNEVDKSIQQADGSAYMAIFVTTSTSYTPPAKYFGDAKIEVKRCIKAMDELASMIDGL